jgi:branched-chain amino acid aminotransferase
MDISEQEISVLELLQGIDSGEVSEVFLTGTAVHLAPAASITRYGFEHRLLADPSERSLMLRLSSAISEIQRGVAADTFGWMYRVPE